MSVPGTSNSSMQIIPISCRSCGHDGLTLILSLGSTPLANALLTPEQLEQPEPTYPLDLVYCPSCSLVQITESVPPAEMFSEYLYFSSFSDTMVSHARHSAETLRRERGLDSGSLVVEIASNDGYMLQHFVQAGVAVLGIEPASNVTHVAQQQGVATLAEFFSVELANRLAGEGKQADVILANNVMAHMPDINNVMAGIKALLKPGGAFVIETPYVKDMIDYLEFDTIYHEHVFYYSLTALENLFRPHGLAATTVERLPIHGGSLRVTATHADETDERQESGRAAVRNLLQEEAAWGVAQSDFYRQSAAQVAALNSNLRAMLQDLKAQGKRIVAYGASAKGSTLLNYFGIGHETLDLAVKAFTRLERPLKVVGDGRQMQQLKAMAGKNVEFLGRVDDVQLPSLIAKAKAFLMPGEEDFGIAPVEANACGRPVIAFAAGGALDTQLDGVTGILFKEQTTDGLCDAVRRADTIDFDPASIREHARHHFDTSVFRRKMAHVVERCRQDEPGRILTDASTDFDNALPVSVNGLMQSSTARVTAKNNGHH